MDVNTFNQKFNNYVSVCEKLFNILESDLNKPNTTRNISDIKKIIILKFYKVKRNNRDNTSNLLAQKFGCYHSNIVYLHNTAKNLYKFDINFKKSYDLFELNVNKK